MPTDSVMDLVGQLRRYRLLEPDQFDQLTDLHARIPDPSALINELLARRWLTPYQATQVLQGRGHQLLLGNYLLLERLGEGGMGTVFKARNWKLGRIVAVKLIRTERLFHPDAVRRFQREVRAAATLSHPNIVLALDADEIDGTHLLVMEYVEGAIDLARLVKAHGPLPVAVACAYVRQAALGLQHAHERKLVHRDIKPHNLLRTADGKTIKLLDLGLARLDRGRSDDGNSGTMTGEGTVMGTPDYIAPEQALESHTVDIRADLYSLGCTLYYLLAGRVPFPGGTLLHKLDRHRSAEAIPIETLRPDVPPAVAAVLRKLMAKKPEDRFQTPTETAAALAAIEGADPASTTDTLDSGLDSLTGFDAMPDADSTQRPRRRRRGRGRLLLGIVAGCAVLIGITALLFVLLREAGNPHARPPSRSEQLDADARRAAEDAWVEQVAALPTRQQVDAVADKLKEVNPKFAGAVKPEIAGDVVIGLEFSADNMTTIWPVRALRDLTRLRCPASAAGKSRVFDLSLLRGLPLKTLGCANLPVSRLDVLKGMPLTALDCTGTRVSDLTPLEGMRLTSFGCAGTGVSDLSPLKGMPLTSIGFASTRVSSLEPLRGMPLETIYCYDTGITDLHPLQGMKLTYLHCARTQIKDLTPLKGMPLRTLAIAETDVADLTLLRGMPLTILELGRIPAIDLSPLEGLPLQELTCEVATERDVEILRSLKTLERINSKPATEFWKELERKKP